MNLMRMCVILSIAIMAVFSVAAMTTTLVTPATNGKYVGLLNATTTNNPAYCEFWALSSSTANSSYTLMGNATNASSPVATAMNVSVAASVLEDAADYSVKATCYNVSGSTNSATNTGIDIDETVPTAPTSLSPTDGSEDEDGDITFSVSVTGSQTTGCTLYFPEEKPASSGSYSMTHSGDTCTYSLTGAAEGSFQWYVTATDGINTTDSAKIYSNVDIKNRGGGAVPLQVADDGDTMGVGLGGVDIGVSGAFLYIIIGAVAGFFFLSRFGLGPWLGMMAGAVIGYIISVVL